MNLWNGRSERHRGDHLDQELANDNQWAISSPLLVFVNQVVLEYCQAHLFTCCLWLLVQYSDTVE